MRYALLAAALAAGLALAGGAAAGGSVQATLNGKCTEVDRLDSNGALKSLTLTCTAKGSCRCDGTMQLTYTSTATEPGTGADGRETGTIVASGAKGTVTLHLAGKHTSLGAGSGTWTLVKSSGYQGVKLARKGTYSTAARTLSQLVGSKDTVVRITASLGCWHC